MQRHLMYEMKYVLVGQADVGQPVFSLFTIALKAGNSLNLSKTLPRHFALFCKQCKRVCRYDSVLSRNCVSRFETLVKARYHTKIY